MVRSLSTTLMQLYIAIPVLSVGCVICKAWSVHNLHNAYSHRQALALVHASRQLCFQLNRNDDPTESQQSPRKSWHARQVIPHKACSVIVNRVEGVLGQAVSWTCCVVCGSSGTTHHQCVIDADDSGVLTQGHAVGVVAELHHRGQVHHNICTKQVICTRSSQHICKQPAAIPEKSHPSTSRSSSRNREDPGWSVLIGKKMQAGPGGCRAHLCHRGRETGRGRSHTQHHRRRSRRHKLQGCAAMQPETPHESAPEPPQPNLPHVMHAVSITKDLESAILATAGNDWSVQIGSC